MFLGAMVSYEVGFKVIIRADLQSCTLMRELRYWHLAILLDARLNYILVCPW